MLDCVNSELQEVKDSNLISYVGDNVQNESIKSIYVSHYVTSDDTLHDTSYDTSDDTQKKDKPSNSNGSYDTSTSRTTYRPQYKEQEQEEDIAEIIKFWDNNGCGYNNVNAKHKLLSWLDDSNFKNPSEMILKALDIASTNDRRTLAYVEGILRNWTNESILTIAEVDRRNKGGATNESRNYDESVG